MSALERTQPQKEARIAGVAGIVFSILSLIVIPFSPELGPPLGSGLDELASYYIRHRQGFLFGNYLGIAAFLPGFVQLAIVTSWIRRREGLNGYLASLVLATGTYGFAVGTVVLVVFQVLPFLVEGDGRLAIHALASLANIGFCLFVLVAMPFVVSVGWAALKTQLFPKWFAYASLAAAPIAVVVSLGALTTEPRWLAAGGVATGFGIAGFFTWTLVLAILSWRSNDPDPAQET